MSAAVDLPRPAEVLLSKHAVARFVQRERLAFELDPGAAYNTLRRLVSRDGVVQAGPPAWLLGPRASAIGYVVVREGIEFELVLPVVFRARRYWAPTLIAGGKRLRSADSAAIVIAR